MKIDKCQYDLETKMVDACDDCRISRFKTHQTVVLGHLKVIITKTYETKTCLMGFAPGNLINAFSLLPKEEQEIEIIRSNKYSSALHEEKSTESEFESEFQNTIRVELGASQDFNTSESASGSVDYFGIAKADVSMSASQHFHFDEKFFDEVIRKTSMKVSNKYDISIDHKTEAENKFRSLRKISNPNPCRVVTFFFKQLNKKYSQTVSLIAVHYDLIDVLHDISLIHRPYYIKSIPSNAQRIYPVLPVQASSMARITETGVHAYAAYTTQSLAHAETLPVTRKELHTANEERIYKKLSEAQLVEKAKAVNIAGNEKKLLDELLKKIKEAPEYKPHVILKREFCIRTNNIMAEPKVSECSICDCNEVGCGCKDQNPTPPNP
ncbi:MAG: hypothetical protein JST82_08375 [Bacteroidetes bacterium]|nr:hypothetical protein [Bacteroidota bacterium]